MKTKIVVTIIVLLIISISGYFSLRSQKEIHYHAGFLVYVDGVLQDFSDTKFMKIEPCAEEGAKVHEDEQLEKGHLHDNVGDVVHVEREGAVWKDLFNNIRYTFPTNAPIRAFVNKKETSNILNFPIKAYDSVIFLVGKDTGVDLTKGVTREHIIEVEKKVESCGI